MTILKLKKPPQNRVAQLSMQKPRVVKIAISGILQIECKAVVASTKRFIDIVAPCPVPLYLLSISLAWLDIQLVQGV